MGECSPPMGANRNPDVKRLHFFTAPTPGPLLFPALPCPPLPVARVAVARTRSFVRFAAPVFATRPAGKPLKWDKLHMEVQRMHAYATPRMPRRSCRTRRCLYPERSALSLLVLWG